MVLTVIQDSPSNAKATSKPKCCKTLESRGSKSEMFVYNSTRSTAAVTADLH